MSNTLPETMPEAFINLGDVIPDELSGMLPDGLFSSDPATAAEAVGEMSELSYIVRSVLDAIGLRLGEALPLLCTLVGLVLIAAVLRALRDTVAGKGAEMFGFCLRLVLFAAIVAQAAGMVEVVQTYFSQMTALTGGMIPVMGVLYALGGNIGQATTNGGLMAVFLAICEYVSATVTPPFCGVCLGFALLDAFEGKIRLAPLSRLIKQCFTKLLGFVMFLLGVVLSAHSVLTSRADSIGMKGIKYAVGNMIPVVGGAVSGSLGTVAATVEMLRGVTGVCGIILLALLLLPAVVQVLLFRWCFTLGATAAEMLACDGEARLMNEMGSLYGYLAAAMSICALFFVLALGIMIHGAVAVGGA